MIYPNFDPMVVSRAQKQKMKPLKNIALSSFCPWMKITGRHEQVQSLLSIHCNLNLKSYVNKFFSPCAYIFLHFSYIGSSAKGEQLLVKASTSPIALVRFLVLFRSEYKQKILFSRVVCSRKPVARARPAGKVHIAQCIDSTFTRKPLGLEVQGAPHQYGLHFWVCDFIF